MNGARPQTGLLPGSYCATAHKGGAQPFGGTSGVSSAANRLVSLANVALIVRGMSALLAFATLAGVKPVVAARTLAILWLVLAATEIARFL